MKLQILIPHYKEELDEIQPLLDSIAIQQSINFEDVGVIIAYDGPDSTPLNADKVYPFDIKQIYMEEHSGVSAARNFALDAATADYVMFCDADDMFCDVCGLYILFNEMDNGEFDTLVSNFREETRHPETKAIVYTNHEMDSTFVHGKVHRRKYLIDNKIRFNDKLTIHEDSYFNILAQNLARPEKAKYCPIPFYLWKWRDNSVCRHDPDYILKTYNNMIDSNDALIDEFVKRLRDDKANFFVGFLVFDAYYLLNKPEWIDKTHSDYRKSVEKRFAKYWAKHKKQFNKLTNEEKMQISNNIRTRSVQEGMLMEAITLEDWLNSVETKYKVR